jgi:hypothetical protein
MGYGIYNPVSKIAFADRSKQITGYYPVRPSHPQRITPDQRLLGAREFEAEIRGSIPVYCRKATVAKAK